MSLNETAEIIGKSVNHVKVLQNRAIQRLRKALLDTSRHKSPSKQDPGPIGEAVYEFAF
jgi:hypothetical protein